MLYMNYLFDNVKKAKHYNDNYKYSILYNYSKYIYIYEYNIIVKFYILQQQYMYMKRMNGKTLFLIFFNYVFFF